MSEGEKKIEGAPLASVYYDPADYDALSQLTGLYDPNTNGELTDTEAKLPGNEEYYQAFESLAALYTFISPLKARYFAEDPALMEMFQSSLEQAALDAEEAFGPPTSPNVDIPQKILPDSNILFGSIEINFEALRAGLKNKPQILSELDGSQPVSQSRSDGFKAFAYFWQKSNSPMLAQSLTLTRQWWTDIVDHYNQEKNQSVDASSTWDEMLAMSGLNIHTAMGYQMTPESPIYRVDRTTHWQLIDAESFQEYLETPYVSGHHLQQANTNTLDHTLSSMETQATATFPSSSLIVSESAVHGVYIDINSRATLSSSASVRDGNVVWDNSYPLLQARGFSLRVWPGIVSPIQMKGITFLQGKIVAVAAGPNYEYIIDITPFVFQKLCAWDPPSSRDCSMRDRLVQTVFTRDGSLRDNIPVHELETAIMRAFQAGLPTSEADAGDIVSQIPTQRIHGEILVSDFSASYTPEKFLTSSLYLKQVQVNGATLYAQGHQSDFQISGEVPFSLNASMKVDEGYLDLDVSSVAWIDFDAASGRGTVRLDLDRMPLNIPILGGKDYEGQVAVDFILPGWDPENPDIDLLLQTALYRLTGALERDNKDWLYFKSSGQLSHTVDGTTDTFTLLAKYGVSASEIKSVTGVLADGVYYGTVIRDDDASDPWVGIGVTSEFRANTGIGKILGRDTFATLSREKNGDIHIRPRSRISNSGTASGSAEIYGEIVIHPHFEEEYATVEVVGLPVSLNDLALSLGEAGSLTGNTDGTLSGTWTVAADSFSDLFKTSNWVGSGQLALRNRGTRLHYNGAQEEVSVGLADGDITLVKLASLSFEDPRLVDGDFSTTQNNVDLNGSFMGQEVTGGHAKKVSVSISGPVLPAVTAQVVDTEASFKITVAGQPLAADPLIDPNDEAMVQMPLPEAPNAPFSEKDKKILYHNYVIPKDEIITEPKNKTEEKFMALQKLVQASPIMYDFDLPLPEMRIGANLEYVNGRAKVPMNSSKPNGLGFVFEKGTEIDTSTSRIRIVEGRVDQFDINWTKPICMMGVEINGLAVETRTCLFTKKTHSVLVAKTCLGPMNLIDILAFSKKFQQKEFYDHLRSTYNIDLQNGAVPRNIEKLSVFIYELYKVFANSSDSSDIVTVDTDVLSSLISFTPRSKFAADFGLNIPSGDLDYNGYHLSADNRQRGIVRGRAEWNAFTNHVDATVANDQGDSIRGVTFSASGSKEAHVTIDDLSNVHFVLDGNLPKGAPFELTWSHGRFSGIDFSYTPTGETDPLFDFLAEVEKSTGNPSFIDGAMRLARVTEETGDLMHYEIQVDLNEAYVAQGDVDFSMDEKVGHMDISHAHLKPHDEDGVDDHEIEIISRSFDPENMDDPSTSGVKKAYVDIEVEQLDNPNVDDEHPALTLSLGPGQWLVVKKMLTKNGLLHVDMDTDTTKPDPKLEGPIQYTGLVDLIVQPPLDDPRIQDLIKSGWIINLDQIAVSGPAQFELNGADGGVKAVKFDESNVDNISITLSGKFRIPIDHSIVEFKSISIPLKELGLTLVKDPNDPLKESPQLRRLALDALHLQGRASGQFTTPDLPQIHQRKIILPSGAVWDFSTAGVTDITVDTPGDLTTMHGTVDGMRLALEHPKDKKTKALISADHLEIKDGSLIIDDVNVDAKVTEALYGTVISVFIQSFSGTLPDITKYLP